MSKVDDSRVLLLTYVSSGWGVGLTVEWRVVVVVAMVVVVRNDETTAEEGTLNYSFTRTRWHGKEIKEKAWKKKEGEKKRPR